MVRIDVIDVHDETIDDDRAVQPLCGNRAMFGMLARAFVRVIGMTHEDRCAVGPLEDDISHVAGLVGEPLHLTKTESTADPLGRLSGVLVREHRDHPRVGHGPTVIVPCIPAWIWQKNR